MEIDKFEGVYFKYNNNFRKILAHKKPNKAFFVPNLDNSFFGKILFISNITIIFRKILAHKNSNKAFFIPNLENSFFGKILELHKIDGYDFKYDNCFFKF